MEVKALSLYQPWASFVMWGLKRVETRSWGTPYRGILVIHASRNPQPMYRLIDFRLPYVGLKALFIDAMEEHGYKGTIEMPLGVALGTVFLDDVQVITPALADAQTETERLVGDWTPGRFAWFFADCQPFETPIPARGYQKLWTFDLPEGHLK